jgi:two-component system response regulator MprA
VNRGVSSAVEHLAYTEGATGSNPVLRTIRPMFSLLRKKRRILVLDDDPAMQRLVRLLLSRAGFRVDVVGRGNAAIDAIQRNPYNAVLLDLMVPVEGGMTVIKHLRAHKPEILQRVIVLTSTPDSVLRTIAGDVSGIIKKPFVADELIAAVERVA